MTAKDGWHGHMSNKTLYQRLLGDNFDKLPLSLQRFHGVSRGGRAVGTLTVKHGAGLLRHWSARALKLPAPGENVAVHLQVVARGDKELWIRHFGGQCFETLQWQDHDFLIEKAGLLHFVYRLSGNEKGIVFDFQHNRLRGAKLPLYASLRAEATARGTDDHWHIEVKITAPLLGLLTTYAGKMTPTLLE